MKKRILALFLVLLTVCSSLLALSSCVRRDALTDAPTEGVTDAPTEEPTEGVTNAPTEEPTEGVTNAPTEEPTEGVTNAPTEEPTEGVTNAPTEEPTEGVTEAPTEEPTEEPTDDPALKPFEELDFGDEKIYISLSKFTSGEIPIESYQFIQGPDRVGSDSVLNLVYERNQNVENVVNILPTYVYTNLGYDGIAEDISKHVMMPSKETPDLYIDQIYGLVRAQMAGHLMNVLTKEEKNHFDFGSKTENVNGWYNPYMNAFNFASDEKMYLLAGDYFMDVIRHLTLTAVNLTDFEAYFLKGDTKNPALGVGKDYLYNTVEQGLWTVDKMIEWSDVAYKDMNNNKAKDKSDRLGVLVYDGGPSAMGILPSLDVSLYQVSADGKYTVAQSDTAFNAITAWQNAFASKGVHLMKSSEAAGGYADLATIFIDGNVLFAAGIQLFQLETSEMKNMEEQKCLIPYPKYSESDVYCVTTHDNARVGGILKTTSKFEAVSAWVQASTVSSAKVINEYYQVALKYKNGVDYGATKMLELVHDSIASPKWIVDTAILSTTNNFFTSNEQNPTHYSRVTTDKTNTYSSKYQSATSRLTGALKAYQAIFNGLK